VRQTVHTNYYGTLEACQALLPFIRSGGRLVNVSSTVSTIGKYGAALQDKFKAASTVSDVSALMEDFKQSAADGTLEQHGWTAAAYAASKAGVTTVTRVLALEEAAKGRGVLVNSCCPGWVQTDMTKGKGQKTLDQGATTPVFLAFGDLEGRHGLFWRDEHPISEVNSSMPS
jgi:carbonyl reductase 1